METSTALIGFLAFLAFGGPFQVAQVVGPHRLDPPAELAQSFGPGSVPTARPVDAHVHEAGVLERPEVLRHRGPADREVGRDLARGPLPVAHQLQDLPPPGLGERFQGGVHDVMLAKATTYV